MHDRKRNDEIGEVGSYYKPMYPQLFGQEAQMASKHQPDVQSVGGQLQRFMVSYVHNKYRKKKSSCYCLWPTPNDPYIGPHHRQEKHTKCEISIFFSTNLTSLQHKLGILDATARRGIWHSGL